MVKNETEQIHALSDKIKKRNEENIKNIKNNQRDGQVKAIRKWDSGENNERLRGEESNTENDWI